MSYIKILYDSSLALLTAKCIYYGIAWFEILDLEKA